MPEWKPLADRFSPGSPKRILSLDGGGIRGALSLGYLEEIEKNLAARHPHITDFRPVQNQLRTATMLRSIIMRSTWLFYTCTMMIKLK